MIEVEFKVKDKDYTFQCDADMAPGFCAQSFAFDMSLSELSDNNDSEYWGEYDY